MLHSNSLTHISQILAVFRLILSIEKIVLDNYRTEDLNPFITWFMKYSWPLSSILFLRISFLWEPVCMDEIAMGEMLIMLSS